MMRAAEGLPSASFFAAAAVARPDSSGPPSFACVGTAPGPPEEPAFTAAALRPCNLRRIAEFHLFLTLFSDLPGRHFAMSLQRFPRRSCSRSRVASSSAVHGALLMAAER